MSIKQGGKTIAGAKQYHPGLFDFKWADHILNDVSWLRADTFSWQAGSVYESAYQHLADDFTNGTRTLVPEGAGIWCYIAPDGHRIVDASDTTQVQNVIDLYNTTGVAWYYIIDTANQRFKLPRAKPLNGNVKGNGTNVKLQILQGTSVPSGLSINATSANVQALGAGGLANPAGFSQDPTKSGMIAERDNTDQYKYLYFYVGNFTQTALENTAGVTTEVLNDKVDKGHQVVEFQAPTAANNYTWYRKYRDGWVEQGGITATPSGGPASVTYPIVMSDSNYTLNVSAQTPQSTSDSTVHGCHYVAKETTRCTIICLAGNSGNWIAGNVSWQVSGMAAQ